MRPGRHRCPGELELIRIAFKIFHDQTRQNYVACHMIGCANVLLSCAIVRSTCLDL